MISKRLRYEILRRDGHTCRYCGATAPGTPLRVDHVTPKALGGTDDPTNLVTACEPCNTGKSSTSPDGPLVADVTADALRWAQAIRSAASILDAERENRDRYVAAFEVEWDFYGQEIGRPAPRPDYVDGLLRLHRANLPEAEVVECVRLALEATHVPPDRRIRYFFGIAASRVEHMHEIARDILVGSDAS